MKRRNLRSNEGGLFDQAVKVAELFLNKDVGVVRTKSRDGSLTEYKSTGSAWSPNTKLVILTEHITASGAELFTAALKEGRGARVVGQATHGKWNAQTVEQLPNRFSIKYSTMLFETPSGLSYQGTGIKPDLEVIGPTEGKFVEVEAENDMKKRFGMDAPLRAAFELNTSN